LFVKDMLIFKNTVIKDIEDDLIYNKVTAASCADNSCTLNFEGEKTSSFTLDVVNKRITYNEKVYEFPNADQITIENALLEVIELDSNNAMLKIDIPCYENSDTEKEDNYGITINHPFKIN